MLRERDMMEIFTVDDAIAYFADEQRAYDFMVNLRWPDGVRCPQCGSLTVHHYPELHRWRCACRKQFTIKSGTIFDNSTLPLGTWLSTIWLEANAKDTLTSVELHQLLGITQKSAWHMLRRIRDANRRATELEAKLVSRFALPVRDNPNLEHSRIVRDVNDKKKYRGVLRRVRHGKFE